MHKLVCEHIWTCIHTDLAEQALVGWIEDKSVPAALRKNAYLHLLTPRKRMQTTIEKLFQLANKKHENRNMAHMVLGALLKRYKTLEGTSHMPKRIATIFNYLHERVHTATTKQELEIALGALGNTHFEQARPTLQAHTKHGDTKVRQRVKVALDLMQLTSADARRQRLEAAPKIHADDKIDSHARKLQSSARATLEPVAENDGVAGNDCAGLFDGSLYCLSMPALVITESDHHSVTLTAGVGIGMDAATEEDNSVGDLTMPPAQRWGSDPEGTSFFAGEQTASATRGADSSIALKGGGGIDVSLANSDPLRMIGVEAAITGDSLGADSSAVECSVTLLGYQVENNFCECKGRACGDSGSGRRRLLSTGTPTAPGMPRYGFEDTAGVVLTHVFAEVTFIQVEIRFFILWVPLSIELSVAGQVWGKLGLNIDSAANLAGNFDAKGGVQPGASAVMSLEVALDLFIVKAGIGGELNIVESGVPLAASVMSTYSPGVCLSLSFSLSLLAGRIYAFIELNFVFWRTRHEVTVTEWAPLWERTIDLLQIPENCYEEAVPKTLPPDGSTPPPSTKYPTQGTQVPVPTPPATSWPTRSPTPPPTIATRMNEGQNCWNACKNDGRCDWCGTAGYCCRNSGWGRQRNGCWNTGGNHGRHVCQYDPPAGEEEELAFVDTLPNADQTE